ncbi:hypothetical protein [Actinomadura sp. WMMB 499]|uniref:hypothetical protein n=1 Tax=Actinomadura sp. WMMB 499 TaxID=1219491 RepID=UPI001245FC08|nr:hypothetical protein [Actinomadura sp. WMMB 499]QFG23428.1 hypothetical protein F7P10_22215 [Actinomadura sp. WMMB 499]
MDEMRAIAEMLDEPPTRTAEDEGRRRLRAEIAHPGRATGRAPGRAGGPARVRFGWPVKAGLGVVAAGAAAAVAIAATGSGTPESPGGPGGTRAAPVDLGKQAVLAAAENAAQQETGKYFYIHYTDGQSYVVPAGTGSYAIAGARSETFIAAGLESGGKVTFYGREPGPRLWTPQDEALWKKAGSPPKLKVWSSDKWLTFDMAKKPPWTPSGTDTHSEWLGDYTIEGLQNLPADPQRLAKRLLDEKNFPEAGRVWEAGAPVTEQITREQFMAGTKIRAVGWRLGGLPIPPKVRAALMKALMAEPGVRAVGATTDPLGREGVALASGDRTVEVTGEFGTPPENQGTYGSREEIVFDKATGDVLAMQNVLTKPGGPYKDREPGFIIDYQAVPDMGWSDTVPAPPEKLS